MEEIEKFINYILLTNNITKNILLESSNTKLKEYITRTLKHVNNKSYELIVTRKRREEIRDDISDLERAFVSADSLNVNEQGKNTGGKENKVELRQIKILELKEELGELISKTMLLEKSLIDNKQIVSSAFDTLLDEDKATIMKLFYIDCFSTSKIAIDLYYTRDTVRVKRHRAIIDMSKEIKKYF